MKRKRTTIALLIRLLQAMILPLVLTTTTRAQTSDAPNHSGFIGDSQGDDIISSGESPTDLANFPGKNVVDMAVSPDGLRAYTIDREPGNKLRVYQLVHPTTPGDPVTLTFERAVDLNIANPTDIVISPDAEYAYISGKERIIKINLKPITLYDATGNPTAVINAFELNLVLGLGTAPPTAGEIVEFSPGVTTKKNLGSIALTPDGQKLVYVLEHHQGVLGGSTTTNGAFGTIGALDISNPLNPALTPLAQQSLSLALPWEVEIGPLFPSQQPTTGTLTFGSSGTTIGVADSVLSAFYAPYEIAISPDGNYALIAGQGREKRGEITPFGVIPDDDDDTGGILVLNLNSGTFLQHIPSAVRNEKSFIRSRLLKFVGVEHPLVPQSEVTGGTQAANAAADDLLLTGGFGGQFEEFLTRNFIYTVYQDIFADFSKMLAYSKINLSDMVATSGLGIAPQGDFGLATFRETNNLGLLRLSPSPNHRGYTLASPPDFFFEAALERTVNFLDLGFGITPPPDATLHQQLYPGETAFTADSSLSYIGTQGGSSQFGDQAFGLVDVEQIRTDASSYPGGSGGVITTGRFILRRHPSLQNPKTVATFKPFDADADGLSDYVEAYNRFNALKIFPHGDANRIIGTVKNPITDPGTPAKVTGFPTNSNPLDYLLPTNGIGYKINAQQLPKDANNAGKKPLITAIETVGRQWHQHFLEGTVQHPRFIITNMSQPGGGQVRNPQGEFLSFDPGDGLQATIQYFRATQGTLIHPDTPFDFVLSNNATSPLHNHIENSPTEFAAADTLELIKLFLAHPDISEIHLDPKAIEEINNATFEDLLAPSYASKIRVRGQLTTNAASDLIDNDHDGLIDCDPSAICDDPDEINYGTRRDLDATLLIVAQLPSTTITVDHTFPLENGGNLISLDPQGTLQPIHFSTTLADAQTVTINFSTSDFQLYLDAEGTLLVNTGDTFRLNDGSRQFWLKPLSASTTPNTIDLDFVANDSADTPLGTPEKWTADVIEIDIDIDSDNSGGPGPATNPTEREHEDDIEETSAKILSVNDQNGTDTIPGYADGFNLDGQDGNDDDLDDTPGNLFVPIEIKVTGPFPYAQATVRITYDHSFPNHIAFPKDTSGTYIRPSGRLRLWKKDAAETRDMKPVNFNEGDFVPSGEYRLDKLDPNFATTGTLTLYLETVKSAADTLDPTLDLSANFLTTNKELDMITMELDPDGFLGPLPYLASDKVKIDALFVEMTLALDTIPTNHSDKDHDGIVDFADGFDADPATPDDDLCAVDAFQPLEITIPAGVDPATATLRFDYKASDPNNLTGDHGIFASQPGNLRLWRKDGNQPRDPNSVAASAPGDYIPNDTLLEASALGFGTGPSTITVYVEGIRQSLDIGDQIITVNVNPDPTLPIGHNIKGHIALTVLDQTSARFVPDANFHRVDMFGFPLAEIPVEATPEIDQPYSGFYVDTLSLHPYFSKADFSVPLADGETRLEFRRCFGVASYANNGSADYSPAGEYNLLGRAWRSNIEVHAFRYDETITIFGEDGKVYRYTDAGEPIVNSSLDASANYHRLKFTVDAAGNLTEIIWKRRFGCEITFETCAAPLYYRPKHIRSRNDNVLIYEYDSATDPRFPKKIYFDDDPTITDENIAMTINYTNLTLPSGIATRIHTVTDPKGNLYTFTYTLDGELEKVDYPSVNVATGPAATTPGSPQQPEESYQYETMSRSNRFGGALKFIVLKHMTDANANTTAFTYQWQTQKTVQDSSDSREIVLKEITLPVHSGNDKTQFTCLSNQDSNQLVTVQVTTPNGTVWNWNFDRNQTSSYPTWDLFGEYFTQYYIREFERTVVRNSALGTDVAMTIDPMPTPPPDTTMTWLFSCSGDAFNNLLSCTNPDAIETQWIYGKHSGVANDILYNHSRFNRPYEVIRDRGGLDQRSRFHYDHHFNKRIALYEPNAFPPGYDPNAIPPILPDTKFLTETILDDKGNPVTVYRDRGPNTFVLMERTFDTFGFITAMRDGDGRFSTYSRTQSTNTGTGAIIGWKIIENTFTDYTGDLHTPPSGGAVYTTVSNYDLNGNLVHFVDGRGNATDYEYDAMNFLTKTIEPLVDVFVAPASTSVAAPVTEVFRDANRNVISVKDPRGNFTHQQYDELNRVLNAVIKTAPADITTITAFDAMGNVVSRQDGNGNITTYHYDELNRMTKETSPTVDVTVVDSNDTVTTTPGQQLHIFYRFDTHAGDNILTTQTWRPTKVVDRRSFPVIHGYDKLFRLTSTRRHSEALTNVPFDPPIDKNEDQRTTYENYDPNGNLGKMTVVNFQGTTQENQITEYLYDLLNRRIQTTQILATPADNIVTTTEYDVMGNQVKVIGPRTNQSTQFEYDGLGRNTKTVVNLDGTATVTTTNNNKHVITGIDPTKDLVTSREYDANSNLTKVTVANTPANQETATTYDVLNRQTQVVDPEGSTTLTFYDLNSNVTKTEDADHFVTTYEFDAANRSIKTTFPNTHSTTVSYDQNSNVITSTDRRNTETETTYDALNRPLESTLKADEDVPTKRQYDQAGNLSVFTDRREHTTHTCFDFANRPILTTMPPMDNTGGSGSNRTKINRTFDNIGNLCALTGDVIEESSRYDRANRRIMHKTGADTDPTQQVVENTFDHSGNVVEQMVKNDAASGGDQVTTYQHDLADRQTQEKLPTVNPTVYTYDRASNILTETDPNGEVVTHAYFKDNLLASKTYSDPAQNKNFTYDARKNLNVVTDETGTLITTYNAMNWLAEEKKMDIPNLLVSTVNHTYDQDGNRIITDYSNTDTIEYAYDKEDRRTQIKQDQKTTTFAYVNDNTANTITTVKPGNEVTIKTFNANGMLQQAQTTRFGKNLYTAIYQFNAIGQRERADETHAESGDPNFRQQTCNYLYDTTGRLGQEAISGGATCTYAYDKAGNRITKTVGADTWTYTVNVLNQITQIQYPDTSIVTLSYDQNGNMKTKGARIFTYDIDNRLVDVENNVGGSSAGDLFSATYDHRNRRFQKTEDGTSTVFAYDNMEAVQELDTSYNVQKEFVRNAFDGTPGEIIHSSTGDEVTNWNFNTVGSTTGIRKRTYPPEIIPSTPTGILPGDLDNTQLYTEVYGNVIDDGGIFVFNPDDLSTEITPVDPTTITPTQLSDTALYTEIYGTVILDNGQYRFQANQTASPGQDNYDFELAGNPLPFNHNNTENRFFRGLALEFVVLEGTVVSEFAIDPATTDRANPSGVDPKEFKLGGNPLPFDHTNTKLRFFQGTGVEFYVLESQTVNEFEIDESTAIISQDDIAFSDAWGNIDSGGDLSLNNRLFNSKEVDNTGLVYFGYRYYDPELGRFINRDLIGFPDGPNNYLLTNNDPVNKIDLIGAEAVLAGWIYIAINDATKEAYVGQAGTLSQRVNRNHNKWEKLIRLPDTEVKVVPVLAELDAKNSGKGTVRSARREALGVVELDEIDRIRRGNGYTMLNDPKTDPATRANQRKWKKLHKVKSGNSHILKAVGKPWKKGATHRQFTKQYGNLNKGYLPQQAKPKPGLVRTADKLSKLHGNYWMQILELRPMNLLASELEARENIREYYRLRRAHGIPDEQIEREIRAQQRIEQQQWLREHGLQDTFHLPNEPSIGR